MCVCVCVFGIHVFKIIIERWFWESKMLIRSLVELHAWLHSYLCFSLIEKLFLSNLDNSSTLNLSVELLNCFLSQSRHLLTARWINQESSCPFDSFSTTGGSIELLSSCLLNSYSTPPRQLNLSMPFMLNTSRHLYLSRFTGLLFKCRSWFPSHFSWSLSRQTCLFTSQNSLTHSKLHP